MKVFISCLLLVAIVFSIGAQLAPMDSPIGLREQFNRELATPVGQMFLERVSEIDRALLFRLEGERIRLAADGFPLLNDIRQADLDEWRRRAQSARTVELAVWEQEARLLLYRSVASVEDAAERSRLEELLTIDIIDFRSHVQRELERLYRQAEYVAATAQARSGQSLPDWRPGSQLDVTDAAIAQRLERAREVGEQALPSIAALVASIGLPEGSDMHSRAELERGLARWQESERDLLRRRFAWERDAQGRLAEGEGQWDEIVVRLVSEQEGWNGTLTEQLRAGEADWNARFEALQSSIDARGQELGRYEQSVGERLGLNIERLRQINGQARRVEVGAGGAIGILMSRIASMRAANAPRTEITALEAEVDFWRSRQVAAAETQSAIEDSIGQLAARVRDSLPSAYRSAYSRELVRLQALVTQLDGQIEIAADIAEYADSPSLSPAELGSRYRSAIERSAAQVERYEEYAAQSEMARARFDSHVELLDIARSEQDAAAAQRDNLRLRYEKGEIEQAELAAADRQAELRAAGADRAAAALERVTIAYDDSRAQMERAFQTTTDQRQQLYRAEALYRYAEVGGGAPEEARRVLAELRSRRAQLQVVLDSVSAAGAGSGEWSERLDRGYLLMKQQELDLKSARQYLDYMRQVLDARIPDQQQLLAELRPQLGRAARVLFAIGDGETYIPSGIDHPLDDLSEIDGIAGIEAYFGADYSHERYSRDIDIWLGTIRPAELEDFVKVYYRRQADFDGVGRVIRTTLFDDTNYQTLKRNPNLNGVGGSQNQRSVRNSLADVEQRVFLDPRSARLYNFFEAMYRSGRLASLQSYAEDVIQPISRNVFRFDVRTRTDEMRAWFCLVICPHLDEARHLDNLARTIAAPDASDEFAQLQGQHADFVGRLHTYRRVNTDLAAWNSPPAHPADESLLAVDFGLEHQPTHAIMQLVEALPLRGPDSRRAATAELLTVIDGRLNHLRGQIDARLTLLSNRRTEQQERYQSLLDLLLGDNYSTAENLTNAARALFTSAALSPDDYVAAELHFASRIPLYGSDARLRALGSALAGVYALHTRVLGSIEQEHAALATAELQAEYRRWRDYAGNLAQLGDTEWQRAAGQLHAMRRQWRTTIRQSYTALAARWNDAHTQLRQRRADWFGTAAEATIRATADQLGRKYGLPGADATRAGAAPPTPLSASAVESSLPAGSIANLRLPKLDGTLAAILSGRTFGRLMNALQALPPGNASPLLRAFAPPPERSVDILRDAAGSLQALMEDVDKHSALLTALRLRESVEALQKRIADDVGAANEATERQIDDLLINAGYTRAGDSYSRRIAIDRTLFNGWEYERNRIGAYRFFRAPEMSLDVELDVAALVGRPSFKIEADIAQASDALRNYAALLFGATSADGDDAYSFEGVSTNFRRHFMQEVERFRKLESNRTLDGLFALHLGYAPIMHRGNPEKEAVPGYGESGRIIAPFLRNEARRARGRRLGDVPWHRLRLWDDDRNNDGTSDILFTAPSLSSVGGLLATAILGPVGGIVNGVLAGALDLAQGGSIGQVALGLAQQLAGSALSAGVGDLFGLFDASPLSGIELTLAEAGRATTESLLTGGGAAFIQSFKVDTGGNLAFDGQGFGERLFGAPALGSFIGRLSASIATSSAIQGLEGFLEPERLRLRDFGTAVGAGVGFALDYAISGAGTLNLFGTRDIDALLGGITRRNSGLLELRLGGHGSALALGSAGVDVGPGRIRDALQGSAVWGENLRIGEFARTGVEYARGYSGLRTVEPLLRTQYSAAQSDRTIATQYERLLAGTDRLRIGALGNGAQARTNARGRGRLIQLDGLGNDRFARLRAGIYLAHEAYRDGLIGAHIEQQYETTRAVAAHTRLAERMLALYGGNVADSGLRLDIAALRQARSGAGIGALVRRAAGYDSSADYWRLTQAGVLHDDGSNNITDANGNLLVGDRTGSKSQSLARAVGLERAAEILGRSLEDLSDYDDETLRDVLGISREEVRAAAHVDPDFYLTLPTEQRQKLAGEALLKDRGMRWDAAAGGWRGGDDVSFALSNRELAGQAYISERLDERDEYERFYVTARVDRYRASYNAQRGNRRYQGLDRLVFGKYDLSGGQIDYYLVEGVQTVDIYDGTDSRGVDRDQPFRHPDYGRIQGNTIAPGSLRLRFGSSTSFAGDALTLNDAYTVGGDYIDPNGLNAEIGGGAWMAHSNRFAAMGHDFRNLSSDGCFISPTVAQLSFMSMLEDWGLRPGYNIEGEVREFGSYVRQD